MYEKEIAESLERIANVLERGGPLRVEFTNANEVAEFVMTMPLPLPKMSFGIVATDSDTDDP